MLMEIDPLPMRGSLVMTMVMIFPSRREVSPAEQLRRSPRLVSPGSASWRRSFVPKACLLFFLGRKTSYSRRWSSEGHQGSQARPHPRGQGVAPLQNFLRSVFFIYSENDFREVSGLFGAVQNRSLIFAPFPAQNSSCRHSPSSCKPCKIRENRHKYCDIMCNNSP